MQLAFLRHPRRHGLENLMVMKRIDERRARERQGLKYLESLCKLCKDNVSPTQLIRDSEDRLLRHHMVANVVNDGTAT